MPNRHESLKMFLVKLTMPAREIEQLTLTACLAPGCLHCINIVCAIVNRQGQAGCTLKVLLVGFALPPGKFRFPCRARSCGDCNLRQ
jgi:hypothetical protein